MIAKAFRFAKAFQRHFAEKPSRQILFALMQGAPSFMP